ncbi:MAG: ATP synthase F1 subunit delta [Acidobacteriota bacterium]
MIRSAIARKYARALTAVAAKKGALPRVVEEVGSLATLSVEQPELGAFLDSPAVSESHKADVAKTILSRLHPAGIDPLTRNFFETLALHRRVSDFRAIAAELPDAVDLEQGAVKALVASATPLDPKSEAALVTAIEAATQKAVRLEVQVEPELLGGLVTRIGSTIYDGSVRTKLRKMKQLMAGGAAPA